MNPIKFTISGKTAELYTAASENCPLVVFNNHMEGGEPLINALRGIDCPELNLLCIGNLNWDHDLSPWHCPPIYKDDPPFTGGADEYLTLLLSEILPRSGELIKGAPSHVCIAGYSLAGLFALYALYKCDVFDRAASISGSLWFPNFREYATGNSIKKLPDKIYLSLGDREAGTRNRLLKTVRENTEIITEHYRQLDIKVSFELNPGNHFKDAEIRSAKGIMAIISDVPSAN